jgi:hypothetical protein
MTGLQLLGIEISAESAKTPRRPSPVAEPYVRSLMEGAHSLVLGPNVFRRLLLLPGYGTAFDEFPCPTYVVSGVDPNVTGVLCVASRRTEVPRLVEAGLQESARRALALRVAHAWRPHDAHRFATGVRSDQSGRSMTLEELRAAVLEVHGAAEAAVAVEVHYRQPLDVVEEGMRTGALVLVGDAVLVPRRTREAPPARAVGVVAVVPASS